MLRKVKVGVRCLPFHALTPSSGAKVRLGWRLALPHNPEGREAGGGSLGGVVFLNLVHPSPPFCFPPRRRYSTASITTGEGKRINESLLNPNWTEEETHWWLEFNVQVSCDQIIESQNWAAAAALPPLRRGAISLGHACAASLPKNETNSKNSFANRKQNDGL